MIGALIIAAAIGAAPAEPLPTVMLRQGDPAPYAGWLVSGERLQEALQVHSDLLLCRDELRTERASTAADQQVAAEKLASCDAQVAELIEAGRGRLTLPTPEWYEHPAFVATVAIVGAALVTSGAWWLGTR